MLPLAGLVAANLAPLVGILAFGWTILEVVTYVWLEGALLALFACIEAPRTLRWRALIVLPPYALGMAVLLFFQALFVLLVFFVMRFRHGFWDVLAEGKGVLDGVLWGGVILVLWRIVHLGLAWAPSTAPASAWRVLGLPAAHALALQAVIFLGALLVRDLGLPLVAVGLLLVLKLGVDVGAYALETKGWTR